VVNDLGGLVGPHLTFEAHSGVGNNLKVGVTVPEQKWGHRSAPENFFLVVPSIFWL